MSRTYKFLIVILIFVACLLSLYIYLKKQQSPTSSAIHAIPINTALVFEVKKPLVFFDKLNDENQFWHAFSTLQSEIHLDSLVVNFDSLLFNASFSENMKRQTFLVSIHETSKNKFSPLFLSKFENKQEAKILIEHFSANFSQKGVISTSRYNQIKVFTFSPEDSRKQLLYYAFARGILLASSNEILLQDAIRQTDSEVNLLTQSGFNEVVNTSGQNVDANLYIQFKYFKNLSHLVMSRSLLKSLGVSHFGNWCALDINLKNQTLLVNGFSSSENTSEEFSQLFEGQHPVSMKFPKYIPAGVEGFTAFGISDFTQYQRNLGLYMEANGELDRYTINQRQLVESFGKDMVSKFSAIFKDELAHIIQADGNSLFLIKTIGHSDAKEFVEQCLKHYASKQQVSFNYLQKEYKVDKETQYMVYKMPVDYLPTRMFGPWFKAAKAEYVTIFEDYIVLANSYQNATQFIYNNVLQKTLSYDKDYQQFDNFLSSKVNFYLFTSLTGNGRILKKALNKKALSFYEENQDAIRDFYAFGWQFSQEENFLYNNILFRLQPSNQLKAATEWQSRLDTLVGIKPVLVRNHYTKEKEIFIQDLKDCIYLLNNSGRILWKKEIDEPIMGEVVQVDYYKNGKLQYLFNTKSKMYMLDRNGNFVERYPIKLPSNAVAPLAIFDYDKRKNYRIFIPLENKKVVAFGIDGKKITGFKFKGADHKIISPVQYFRVNNKDYIIITDESRTYITDRKGNDRIKLQKQFSPSRRNKYILQTGNSKRKSRLVRTSSDGTIYYIYFDGTVDQKIIAPFSQNHFFSLEDVTGDHVSDFVFIDEDRLEVHNLLGKKMYDFKFSSSIQHSPAFYEFSANNTYIGVTDAENREIHLIDQKGKELKGFPLPGKTQFSIGVLKPGSGRFSLIVGGDNQYLYNYKLN